MSSVVERRMRWVVVLFTAATAATAAMDKWTSPPLDGPMLALVITAVGALLLGLSSGPAPPPTGGEALRPAEEAPLPRAEEEN